MPVYAYEIDDNDIPRYRCAGPNRSAPWPRFNPDNPRSYPSNRRVTPSL